MVLMNVLNSLQIRNNSLKSKLRHEQLKHGNYSFKSFDNDQLKVIEAYKTYNSIFRAASIVGIDKDIVMDWFVKGLKGNSNFRNFYLAIHKIDMLAIQKKEILALHNAEIRNDGYFSHFENAWIYTAEIDGEKISIISGNLNNLKAKVKSKNLPL